MGNWWYFTSINGVVLPLLLPVTLGPLCMTFVKSRSERCGSGIWWEAGDGDVFIGKDAGWALAYLDVPGSQ